MADAAALKPEPAHAAHGTLPRSAWAWAAFEGFRNPAVVLITIYVFMPYYVRSVAATPVAGQALVAEAGQYAGWAVALTAPLLGLVVDRLGPRKPMLAITVLAMVPLYAAMWLVMPGGPIGPALFLLIASAKSMLFAWTEVLHNALLLPAAHGRVAQTSGLGLALGNGVSVMFLVGVMWAFALPGAVDWPWVPDRPLFGIDPAQFEQARITGPIVAASLLVGLAIILKGVPDVPATGARPAAAIRQGFGDLMLMLRALREEREAAKFLLARMLYVDGKTAILLFSGVLAAGTMGWGTLEMLAYGILLSVVAVLGGLLGGWLDTRIGPKQAVLMEIGATAVILLLLLGTRPDRIAWFPASNAPLFAGPMFTTLPELAFVGLAGLSAISITAAYASSRTMLTVLVPPERVGTFFGLYALSGTATMWLGPLLVALGTRWTQSQHGGFATVLLLLGAGFLVMLSVNAPHRTRGI